MTTTHKATSAGMRREPFSRPRIDPSLWIVNVRCVWWSSTTGTSKQRFPSREPA